MALSKESRALRRCYAFFTREVDPNTVVPILYGDFLLTLEEKRRAMQKSLTAGEQLNVVFDCLERRVSADPAVFHKLVQVLLGEPALEAVGKKTQACYDEEQALSASGGTTFSTPPESLAQLSPPSTSASQPSPLRSAPSSQSSKRFKRFTLLRIINALKEAEFAAAHWERLGLQLNRPPAQLTDIRADHSDANSKLTSMINQWMRSDRGASWETLAAALSETPGYGPATADRLKAAIGLPDDENDQDDQKMKENVLRKREVAETDQGGKNGAETQSPQSHLDSQSSADGTVPLPKPSSNLNIKSVAIFCLIGIVMSILVAVVYKLLLD